MNIDKIIKNGLTGEEVGKIMIKDLAWMYEKGTNDEAILRGEKELKHSLSQSEMKKLVDSLNTNKDIKAYNNYKKLHDYLNSLPSTFAINNLDAESMYWKFHNLISNFYNAEIQNDDLRSKPTIMTEKQYKELYKKEFDKIMTEWSVSVEDLIFNIIGHYFNLYEQGEKTKFNKYFDKAKKEKISNERIKNDYWEDGGYYILPNGIKSKDLTNEEWQKELHKYPPFSEMTLDFDREITPEELLNNLKVNQELGDNYSSCKWIEEKEKAPETETKFDVLEYVEEFYCSYITDTATIENFEELKQDYPELYKETLNLLFSMKGLEFLKDIPEEKYFDIDLISYEILYKNKILNYGNIDSTVHIQMQNGYNREIAVIQGNSINTDEKGYYKETEDPIKKEYLAENFLSNYSLFVPIMVERIKSGIKESLVIKETLKLLAEYIDIPEIEIMLGEVTLIDNVYFINNLMQNIPDFIFRYGGASELREKTKELLKLIDLKELRPSPEAIKKASKIINLDIFVNNEEERIYKILRGVE